MTDQKPLTLWHASRADVERPTIAGRTEGTNHANSGLGIFCATAPHSYIRGFGETFHALTLREDARLMTITSRDLAMMGQDGMDDRDRAWFDAKGREFAKDYDAILIAEHNGWTSQAIIIRDDAVSSSRRLTKEEFAAVSYPMDVDAQAYEKTNPPRHVRSKGPTNLGSTEHPALSRRSVFER